MVESFHTESPGGVVPSLRKGGYTRPGEGPVGLVHDAVSYFGCQTFRWEPALIEDQLEINKYVNDKLQEVITVEEEVLTTAVVEALRQKGYIVIAPEDQEYDGL